MNPRTKRLLAVVVPVQVALAVLAFVDLARRPPGAVRGPKWFWRLLIPLNPGNALVYWVIGRRSSTRSG